MAHIDRQDTYNKIIEIVAEKLNIDKSTIASTSTLEALGADSLDMVEIIMKLEEQFDIEIDDEKAESLTTLDEVVNYVHSLRQH
jgi:acyl carrier protein